MSDAEGPLKSAEEPAAEILRIITESSALCNQSLRVVMAHQSLGQAQVFGRLVGDFMGMSCTNLMMPIWQTYPELAPDYLNRPYAETVPTLEPESAAAIRAFLEHSSRSLARIKQLLGAEQAIVPLRGNALQEIDGAETAIRDFLETPRLRDDKVDP